MPSDSKERVFAYVRRCLLDGLPPSLREAQAALGFRSVRSVQKHLDRLVAEGRLGHRPGLARGLRLPGPIKGGAAVRVPVLGQVQAGGWNLAVEDLEAEEHLAVQTRYAPERLFALRVQGESMTGAHILPGDRVVALRGEDAESGQIVVAAVGDEATVKFLRRKGRRVELHPANPAFPVLRPAPEELSILGRVIEVRRELA